MFKKLILIAITLVFLAGCSTQGGVANTEGDYNREAVSAINSPAYQGKTDEYEANLTVDEQEARNLEKTYFETKSDSDLKALCVALSVMLVNKTEFNQMILDYYPKLFDIFDSGQMDDVSNWGMDTFYARYISAYFAAGDRSNFESAYYEYKNKADNIYYYAYALFADILSWNTPYENEYIFFYEEAKSLYDQSITDDAGDSERLDVFYCIITVCDKMGKDEEYKRYSEEYLEFVETMKEND